MWPMMISDLASYKLVWDKLKFICTQYRLDQKATDVKTNSHKIHTDITDNGHAKNIK